MYTIDFYTKSETNKGNLGFFIHEACILEYIGFILNF